MKSAVLVGEEGLLTLCAEYLLERNWHIVGVVTNSVEVSAWATKTKLAVFENLAQMKSTLKDSPDYLFSVTNFSIIPESIISWVRFAAFNFHDGPLPDMAGLNTPSWAILHKKNTHGISWHVLTPEVDGGGVVIRSDFDIDPEDSALQLNAKCFELGFEGFQELLQAIEKNNVVSREPETPHSYFGRSQKPKYLGFINWNDSAEEIKNLFRATAYAGYRNGLVNTKILLQDGYVEPSELSIEGPATSEIAPGTLVEKGSSYWIVQTGLGAVKVTSSILGEKAAKLKAGDILPDVTTVFPGSIRENELGHIHDDMAWVQRIIGRELLSFQHLPTPADTTIGKPARLVRVSENLANEEEALAAVALLIGRMNSFDTVSLAVSTENLRKASDDTNGFLLQHCPVFLDVETASSTLIDSCSKSLAQMLSCPPLSSELFTRIPALKPYARSYIQPDFVYCSVANIDSLDLSMFAGIQYGLAFSRDDKSIYLLGSIQEETVAIVDQLLATALGMIRHNDSLTSLSFARESDFSLLESINRNTRQEYRPSTIDALVLEQARSNPAEIALSWKGETCTYQQLSDESARVAGYLKDQGYKSGSLIGVMLENKIEAVYTMLGILRSGNAYVPLDPSYPRDRLAYIASDAGLACIFSDLKIAKSCGLPELSVSPKQLPASNDIVAAASADPAQRAYVIYTSGSTGKPKGVQVSHDNVVNFMLGMDGVIDSHEGTMLSVTSISFDISVLEIWWSLTRGLKVVFYDETNTIGNSSTAKEANAPIQFSLYFWNTQDPEAPSTVAETYDLLREAVHFADVNGFEAVWSPERHFGSFGGPFPNPGITSAALATITSHVKIRAGSCVVPLHHPIRVAEDWSMIDNLSQGRVGISFASGWMPQDFAIAPQNFARAKEIMFENIEQVRKLWRGESVEFEGPKGPISVQTLPRPVQKELPCWVTTAGSPDTFAQAGVLGLNVLTHLLGQSADELEEKIKVYRDAWRKAGHPGSGCVSLMLHTFVTDSKEYAREISRGPMKAYLKSAMNLVKAAAWEFPTFKKMESSSRDDMDEYFNNLTEEDMDDLLEFAFQRYFEESGLFGSPSENLATVEKLQAIGVNEIGCLIDFGIRPADVLENLTYLNELKSLSTHLTTNNLNKIVEQFDITHMQCTPSQANMFSLDSADLAGLAQLHYLLVGGEALSQNLADKLSESVTGKVINMYGPTETTVWSLTKEVEVNKPVQIGLPIANTTVHILDHRQRSIPTGWLGELYIGGKGVSLGYLNRPELNALKFVMLNDEPLYATGDSVRMGKDGNIEFLGRNDHQVKIRGYRIELGEIESALEKIHGIEEAVVVGEPDQWGETQLVGYFTSKSAPDLQQIREQLGRFLPVFMVPSKLNLLTVIPRTLNGKVDRKALKSSIQKATTPKLRSAEKVSKPTGPGNPAVQREILEIWQGLLELNDIDLNANFFDIGGHSILAVRLQGILSKRYGRRIPISELFRYPTIAGLAAYLTASSSESKPAKNEFAQGAVSRAARRKARFNRS